MSHTITEETLNTRWDNVTKHLIEMKITECSETHCHNRPEKLLLDIHGANNRWVCGRHYKELKRRKS